MSSAAKSEWNWKVFSCFTEGGKAVLHGATSWGFGCAMPNYPGVVFANVFQMMSFVEHVLVKLLYIYFAQQNYENFIKFHST